MGNYQINKGVGKPVEFKGLRSAYLIIFACGLLGLFFLYVILHISGVTEVISIPLTIVCGVILITGVFRMNKKYGSHGLMKRAARNRIPRRISSDRPISRLFK